MIGGELTQVESTNGLKFPSIFIWHPSSTNKAFVSGFGCFWKSDTGSYEPADLGQFVQKDPYGPGGFLEAKSSEIIQEALGINTEKLGSEGSKGHVWTWGLLDQSCNLRH